MTDAMRLGKARGEYGLPLCPSKGHEAACQKLPCLKGEVDLIALDGKTVVFIEVKTRSI